MKAKKWIIGACALVLVLVGVLIALYAFGFDQTAEEVAQNSSVNFYSESNQPDAVTVSNDEGSFTLHQTDGAYTIDELENIPLNETYCSELLSAAQTLSATDVFEPQEDLASYGLDAPSTTVTAVFGDEQKTLKIGAQSPDQAGYYCLQNDDQTIALVSSDSLEPFLRDCNSYASLTLTPASDKEMDANGNWVSGGATSCTITRSDLAEPVVATAGSDCKLSITSPEGWSMDEDTQTQMENAFFSLSATSMYAANPSEEQLVSCGLNQPQTTVSYEVGGKTYTLKIGAVADTTQYDHSQSDESEASEDTVSTEYYVMLDGTPAIYTVADTSLPWLTMQFQQGS